jgi:hypothetical protein
MVQNQASVAPFAEAGGTAAATWSQSWGTAVAAVGVGSTGCSCGEG